MNKLIGDLMIHSYQKPYLRFSHEVFEALSTLLSFLGKRSIIIQFLKKKMLNFQEWSKNSLMFI